MARRVDDLGRIVLPVELRRLFGIRTGDELAISVDDGTICLKKVEVGCVICDGTDGLRTVKDRPVCADCAAQLAGPAAVVPA